MYFQSIPKSTLPPPRKEILKLNVCKCSLVMISQNIEQKILRKLSLFMCFNSEFSIFQLGRGTHQVIFHWMKGLHANIKLTSSHPGLLA